jgi:hypothetical protein
MNDSPVVLLGRGGSGTRLLSQLGLANGIFLGNAVNVSGDSVEWVETIYALAIESVTTDLGPGSARDFAWRATLNDLAARILAAAEPAAADLWGWKLPETMLVLPQVLRTFPSARLIHLVRHPLSSALRRTHVTSRTDNEIGRTVLGAAYRDAGLDAAGIERDDDYLHNAVTWDFQLRGVLAAVAQADPPPRVLQLRYEDVCADPVVCQERIAAFLGRSAPSRHPLPAIDRSRMNDEFTYDERSERVWTICGSTASRLGYGPAV